MYVRYRKIRDGKTRVQIVECYRVKNRVVQKELRHVGTAKDDAELEDTCTPYEVRVSSYWQNT